MHIYAGPAVWLSRSMHIYAGLVVWLPQSMHIYAGPGIWLARSIAICGARARFVEAGKQNLSLFAMIALRLLISSTCVHVLIVDLRPRLGSRFYRYLR